MAGGPHSIRNNGRVDENRPTRVLLLGSTGSIGTQALEVVAANPDKFTVVGLAAGGGNVELLARQIRETGVSSVAVADPGAAAALDLPGVLGGPGAVTELVRTTEADVVLNALVGSLGLEPTLAALESGARLALANKESLVAGGPLVTAAGAPGQIVPVDSEHSALAQCLRGGSADEVDRLVLTASGGPFRGWTADRLESVTPEQAGAHPTWSMGPMNTLNSATLVNKGLELIETHLLFGVDYDRIDVTVHPQSIVHSMVTFTDGSTLAQASPPDMKLRSRWPSAGRTGWRAPPRPATSAPRPPGSSSHSTRRFFPPSTSPARRARVGDASPPSTTLRTRSPLRHSWTGSSGSRASSAPSPPCCPRRTSGRRHRLPWKTYWPPTAGHVSEHVSS